MIKENDYMKIETKQIEKGRYRGSRVFKEDAILALLKTEMRAGEIIIEIKIPGDFLPLGAMWIWLVEREKEGKIERVFDGAITIWRRKDESNITR